MRVFLRTETGEIITIQTVDTMTVRELKQAALDSGRSRLPLDQTILFDCHIPIDDEGRLISSLRKPVVGTPNTWLWLAERADPSGSDGAGADPTAAPSCVLEAKPAPDEEGVRVGGTISLLIKPPNGPAATSSSSSPSSSSAPSPSSSASADGIVHRAGTDGTVPQIHPAITLRGPCDTLVPTASSATWSSTRPGEPPLLKVTLTPEFPLDPLTAYTVAVNSTLLLGRGNGLASYVASFTTGSCASVRVMLRERSKAPGDVPNSKMLMTLARTSGGLYGELLTAIANRTGCAVQRVGKVVATQARRKGDPADGSTVPPTWAISSSSGCLKLSTGDLVEYEQLSEADAAPTIIRNEAAALQTREEYVKANYVNEESGYFCVVGKMTPEEEAEAVLKLYELVSGSDSEKTPPAPIPPILQELLDGAPRDDGGTGTAGASKQGSSQESAMDSAASLQSSSHIPSTLVDNPWSDASNQPTVYSLSELHAAAAQVAEMVGNGNGKQQQESSHALLKTWRLHGYFFVRLEDTPDEAPKASLESTFQLANAIFGLPAETKATLTDAQEVYLGYQDRTSEFEKELFQIRESRGHEAFWQRVMSSASSAAAAAAAQTPAVAAGTDRGPLCALRSLSAIAHAATKLALSGAAATAVASPEHAGANASFAEALRESAGGPHEHRQVSESNVTLFRYSPKARNASEVNVAGGQDQSHKKRKTAPPTPQCPYHTDVGLVTIIPRCHMGAGGGLRLLDYATMRWIDFEAKGCPPDVAVVFGGESLAHLTGNLVMPAVHDVLVKTGETRTSVVYQHLGARDTRIPPFGADHGNGSGGGGGGGGGGSANVASSTESTMGELVRAISASRRSSNFPAELVRARRQGGAYGPR